MRATCFSYLNLLDFMFLANSPNNIKSTNNEIIHYAIFSVLLLTPPH
jgi:hypothetical protein